MWFVNICPILLADFYSHPPNDLLTPSLDPIQDISGCPCRLLSNWHQAVPPSQLLVNEHILSRTGASNGTLGKHGQVWSDCHPSGQLSVHSVQETEVAIVSAGHSSWLLQGQPKAHHPGKEDMWTEVFLTLSRHPIPQSINANVAKNTHLQSVVYMSNETLLPKRTVSYTTCSNKSRAALRRRD